jgi:hypothetical protein
MSNGLTIEPRYAPRPARFVRIEDAGDWRLKVYGLGTPGKPARSELIEATVSLAAEILPRPALTDQRYGAGFTISHDALSVCFALIYWWQSGNELHQRCYMSRSDDPRALSKLPDPGAGCVFELGIIDFERRAWINDVIGNPRGPDLDRYFARRLTGEV